MGGGDWLTSLISGISNAFSGLGSSAFNAVTKPAGGGTPVAGPALPGTSPAAGAPGGAAGPGPGIFGTGREPDAGKDFSLLALVGQALQGYQRYQQQQKLQDPSYINKQVSKLAVPRSAELMAAYGPGIEAELAQRGLAGAPGLMATALAQATIPQAQQEASSEYFQGLDASERMGAPTSGMADVSKLIEDLFGAGGGTTMVP